MKANTGDKKEEVKKRIASDRQRTNLLRNIEQRVLVYLVQRIPPWISSDMLTAIGLSGNFIVFCSFLLGTFLNVHYLLLSIPGFLISWFGDSLDGRLAYYRKKPRKQYGFVLDITIDWIGIILIGCGYLVYSEGIWDILGYGFVVFYGWEMMIALLRYKLTGNYSIDTGKLGPTEARIILAGIFIMEVLLHGSMKYSLGVAMIILFIVNVNDTHRLLKLADQMDKDQADK